MFNNTSIKILSKLGLIYCGIQLALRVFLFFLSAQDVSWQLGDVLRTLGLGFGFDCVVVFCLLTPLFLFLLFTRGKIQKHNLNYRILQFGIASFFGVVIFTSVCEYYFWEEFHTRFNFIAVDYLIYTKELIDNIRQSYPVTLLILGVLGLSMLLVKFFLQKVDSSFNGFTWAQRLKNSFFYTIVLITGLVILKADYTSLVSGNRYNQEIAGNGMFQLFHAFFHNQLDYNRFYLHIDDQQVLHKLQRKLVLDGSQLVSSNGIARLKNNSSVQSFSKPNIVIITVESLSASFTGFANKDKSLTPQLDALTKEGFSFRRVYATGTRTVRGLEAIALSVPPTPGQSIVRRPDSDGLYTVGSAFQKLGYKTQFVYGGYGYFDNMNGFFRDNGFDIFDRTDIPKEDIYCETVWGVADEIMFKHALKQLDQKTAQGPTLQLILTTSNHRPFIFPEGSLDAPQKQRSSVVRYTDLAIHKFIEEAKTKPWFDNTVFIILADHNADVAGKTGLPVSKYHIPCVVYAPKLIEPGENNRLMSQIDVLPTVCGMLGMDYEVQDMGYDINRLGAGKERAFIATYQEIGYITKDMLIVLQPNNKVSAYRIEDYTTDKYQSIEPPKELVEEAITWYQGASYSYKNKLLKLNQ